ncbi:GapS1 family protein [Cupriavidus sp. RAF12]|uniref:GapS1 family protein n=1 Tax=Cupriavidus sp. RAF12 TaxID=3233050 RepID=UPI003F939932
MVLPISTRLVNGEWRLLEDFEKPGIKDEYTAIMARLRQFSAASVVVRAFEILRSAPQDPVEELATAPWLTLLIVKWALQDPLMHYRTGASISRAEMDSIRQLLWQQSNGRRRDGGRPRSVFLMLRALMYPQLEFQRQATLGFLRWPALYARLPANSISRRQFKAALGVEPNVFIDIAFALFAQILNGHHAFKRDILAPLRAAYGRDLDTVCNILVRDLADLRLELQKPQASRIAGKLELYEFPYVKRFPLLHTTNGELHSWHPLVFARGVEDAVHLRLSEHYGGEYSRSFSRVFEKYVTELTDGIGYPRLTEEELKTVVSRHSSAVEAILELPTCNVLIEAKMSLFADDVLLTDDENTVFSKTERCRDAINQGWNVGKIIREHTDFGNRYRKPTDFLIVVTSRDLLLGGGRMLVDLFRPGAFAAPDEDSGKKLPLNNVFIMGIEDFECLMGCVAAKKVDLEKVLHRAATANVDGRTGRLYFTHFLADETSDIPSPPLITSAANDAEARLVSSLPS